MFSKVVCCRGVSKASVCVKGLPSNSTINDMVIHILYIIYKSHVKYKIYLKYLIRILNIIDPSTYCIAFAISKYSYHLHFRLVFIGMFIGFFPLTNTFAVNSFSAKLFKVYSSMFKIGCVHFSIYESFGLLW